MLVPGYAPEYAVEMLSCCPRFLMYSSGVQSNSAVQWLSFHWLHPLQRLQWIYTCHLSMEESHCRSSKELPLLLQASEQRQDERMS